MITYKEIEQKRRQLIEILNMEPCEAKLVKLVALAKEVGASVTRMEKMHPGETGFMAMLSTNAISETEIVQNIHTALQTATTVAMCHTASRSHIIAIIAALIAMLSMLAAWAAAIH